METPSPTPTLDLPDVVAAVDAARSALVFGMALLVLLGAAALLLLYRTATR
jgi:hypothetical protein